MGVPKILGGKGVVMRESDSPIYVAQVADVRPEDDVTRMDDVNRWWHEVSGRRAHLQHVKDFVESHVHSRLPRDGEGNKTYEKLVFLFSVTQVVFLAICVSNAALVGLLPWYFTIITPILMIFRYFQYHQRKHHYFMLDFCYWAQALTIIYLWAVPGEPIFFLLMYSLAHGPMAWTIPTYRNSLVFHSMDRFTSVFIHFAPMLVLYGLRWYPEARSFWHEDFVVIEPEWDPQNNSTEEVDWKTPFLIAGPGALGVYEVWQSIYAFIVGTFSKRFGSCMSVYHDKEKMTLYRYTSQQGRGWLYNLVMIFGPKYSWYTWVAMNMFYTMLVCLPSYLWYRYFWANTVFVIFIFIMAVWNGANFYLEAFAKIQWRREERMKKKKSSPAVKEVEDVEAQEGSESKLPSDSDSGSDEQLYPAEGSKKSALSCNPLLQEIGGPEE